MARSKTILTVKANPSGPPQHGPMDVYTWRLMKDAAGYKLSVNRVSEDRSRQRKVLMVSEKAADRWLHRLRSVRVSLLPEISDSCDGSYYTFKFENEGVCMELCWHNIAPIGAEALDKFVDLLWKLVPDQWTQGQASPNFPDDPVFEGSTS